MTNAELRDNIISVLYDTDGGQSAEAINERLSQQFGVDLGLRALQEELKEMVEDGELERERLSDGTPGRPPYYYFVKGSIPKESNAAEDMGDEVPSGTALNDDGIIARDLTSRGEIEVQEYDEHKSVSGLPGGVYWDIVETQLENSKTVSRIKEAAPDIAELNPIDTIIEMIEWAVGELNSIGRDLFLSHQKGQTGRFRVLRDLYEDLSEWAKRYFHRFWQLTPYSRQGPDILRVPGYKDFIVDSEGELPSAEYNESKARKILQERVFGDQLIQKASIDRNIVDVVGTDSSVARVSLPNQSRLAPETGFELFAGAAALDHKERRFTDLHFDPKDLKDYRRREAFRRGLILSEKATPLLEGQVRKARFAALDLRQYREAIRIINDDEVNWRPHGNVSGELEDYTGPDVMFLDGRLTPIVHMMSEFTSDDIYGQLVRREIREFARLSDLASDERWETDTTFAGVVKEPGISWFAPIVFWYLETVYADGDERERNAVIRNITQPPISDVVLPHLLFTGITSANGSPESDEVFTTFRVLRRYYDNSVRPTHVPPEDADGNLVDIDSIEGWMKFFRADQARREELGHQTIDVEKFKKFGFANVCANVGTLMCYAGPPNLYQSHQRSLVRLPRIEVLTNPPGDAKEKLNQAISAFALQNYSDDEHSLEGFSTLKDVSVVVPNVIVEADKIAKYARDRISDDIAHDIQKVVRQLR